MSYVKNQEIINAVMAGSPLEPKDAATVAMAVDQTRFILTDILPTVMEDARRTERVKVPFGIKFTLKQVKGGGFDIQADFTYHSEAVKVGVSAIADNPDRKELL